MAGLPPDGSPAEDESMTMQSMYNITAYYWSEKKTAAAAPSSCPSGPSPLHELPLCLLCVCLLCVCPVERAHQCALTCQAPLRAAGAGVTVSDLDGDGGAGRQINRTNPTRRAEASFVRCFKQGNHHTEIPLHRPLGTAPARRRRHGGPARNRNERVSIKSENGYAI